MWSLWHFVMAAVFHYILVSQFHTADTDGTFLFLGDLIDGESAGKSSWSFCTMFRWSAQSSLAGCSRLRQLRLSTNTFGRLSLATMALAPSGDMLSPRCGVFYHRTLRQSQHDDMHLSGSNGWLVTAPPRVACYFLHLLFYSAFVASASGITESSMKIRIHLFNSFPCDRFPVRSRCFGLREMALPS